METFTIPYEFSDWALLAALPRVVWVLLAAVGGMVVFMAWRRAGAVEALRLAQLARLRRQCKDEDAGA